MSLTDTGFFMDVFDDPPKSLVRYVINRYIPFHVAARQADIELPPYEGSCFCPFHANTDTPAAKLYRDDDGDSIYCFAEQRSYRPFDLFRLAMIRKDPTTVFLRIWLQLSASKREQAVQETNAVHDHNPLGWDELQRVLHLYKDGTVQYINICEALLQLQPNRSGLTAMFTSTTSQPLI